MTSTIVILKKLFKDLGAALGLVLFSCAVASIIGPVIVGELLHLLVKLIILYNSRSNL